MKENIKLRLITPLFSRGAYEQQPEVRPASIRGQLRGWFRLLGHSAALEKAVFGGVHTLQGSESAVASKVVIRVSGVEGKTGAPATLPHKGGGGKAAPKAAYMVNTQFTLHVSTRLGGLPADAEKALKNTLWAWIHAGALGNRATRGGGGLSFVEDKFLTTPSGYANRLATYLAGGRLRYCLLQIDGRPEANRHVLTDTLGGPFQREHENDLRRLNDPLGKVQGNQRKTSPLKLRFVEFKGGQFGLLAVWDDRQLVTGNRPEDLQGIIDLLRKKNKPLGQMLPDTQIWTDAATMGVK